MVDNMAKSGSNGPTKATAAAEAGQSVPTTPKVKRENKPRTFYMAYKGQLTGEPVFVFDKDELVDLLTNDRDTQVKRITVPVGKRAKQNVNPATGNPIA